MYFTFYSILYNNLPRMPLAYFYLISFKSVIQFLQNLFLGYLYYHTLYSVSQVLLHSSHCLLVVFFIFSSYLAPSSSFCASWHSSSIVHS
ncbi:hypothetical protein C2G38_2128633 [Gigaspora rosea]|uniref:Uncharacterized protein n=1 Tax=Gigaspora rosea TaxID=44941 RepID=A0A397TU96_9GLOM|nr:hypothetical protein C2G38_2128633 [Gigaspora rosea]